MCTFWSRPQIGCQMASKNWHYDELAFLGGAKIAEQWKSYRMIFICHASNSHFWHFPISAIFSTLHHNFGGMLWFGNFGGVQKL